MQSNANAFRNHEARKAFIQRRDGTGLNLSDKVWKYTNQFKTEIELALEVGMSEGKSAQKIAQEVKQYQQNPDKLFRRVRDKNGNLKLSKNAKAYHPGQGVYRSSHKNAMRLARTEGNMAYHNADWESYQGLVLGLILFRLMKPLSGTLTSKFTALCGLFWVEVVASGIFYLTLLLLCK